jgi:hypothetical protein
MCTGEYLRRKEKAMSNLKRCIMLVSFIILLPGFTLAADTWIVYYSRSGNNKMIAGHIQSQMPGAHLVEIKTTDDRSGILGFITSMLDQWLDRDAEIDVEDMQMGENDTVIMCAPIWLQNLSSPARTLIKQPVLKGRRLYLFITYGGRMNEEKQKVMEIWIRDQGISLAGVYGSAVGGKTEEDIKKLIDDHLKQAGLLTAGQQ